MFQRAVGVDEKCLTERAWHPVDGCRGTVATGTGGSPSQVRIGVVNPNITHLLFDISGLGFDLDERQNIKSRIGAKGTTEGVRRRLMKHEKAFRMYHHQQEKETGAQTKSQLGIITNLFVHNQCLPIRQTNISQIQMAKQRTGIEIRIVRVGDMGRGMAERTESGIRQPHVEKFEIRTRHLRAD
ncbi:hypothetical protein C8J57DRAFT_1245816 [Mycena rebaudengoi]|nr:hypothetical protein C8J57DRAFT_1245816 [Mycena rebaudengoi]